MISIVGPCPLCHGSMAALVNEAGEMTWVVMFACHHEEQVQKAYEEGSPYVSQLTAFIERTLEEHRAHDESLEDGEQAPG